MLFWLQHKWSAVWLLILAFGGLTLFLYGFFPLKYHSGKLAHMDDLPNFIDGVSIDGYEVYKSGENSVILMVIDGLRYDFASEEYMPYTGQLIKNKSACIYVSVAEPPTVTMPRIKSPERKKERAQWRRTINFWRDIFAMMTGSVSTFADVALNFGAPAVKGDSVLRVATSRGRHSILYGDDTWLRLFPGLWSESDGTTSFFVTDYTEVDNNVTRHLDTVLTPLEDKKPKFDFLVLHYLGLDHIGHLEGARSPKIKPKLIEMDNIVKKIHKAMETWNRSGVLIICGDHGMRDAGGHGGASPAEVLVPLVALKTDSRCPHELGPGPIVAQVDIAPTVAWLLNAPIPGDSTGKFLPSLLPTDIRQHLYLLHVNALHNVRQGVATDNEHYKQLKRAEAQFARFLSTGQESAARIAKEFYDESLAAMSKQLADATADFDVFALGLATLLLYFTLTALVCVTLYSLQPEEQRRSSVTDRRGTKLGAVVAFAVIFAIAASTLTLACFITETRSRLCSFGPSWSLAFVASAFALTCAYFVVKAAFEKVRDLSTLRDLNAIDCLLVFGTLFHAWSFFGTSFIEEEHMTWYFFWNTLMFFILVRTIVIVVVYFGKRLSGATEVQEKPDLESRMSDVGIGIVPKWVLLIALHRYLRTMNQTGDRWLFLPDTADWLNAPENSIYLQAHLIIGTLMTFAICLKNVRYMNNNLKIHTLMTSACVVCVFLYRISTNSLQFSFGIELDQIQIVEAFWWVLAAQTTIEIVSYVGVFSSSHRFVYSRPKAKAEDYVYDTMLEPWNLNDVLLHLTRSLTHIMYNQMMMIIILLMRPHNVIMVPSVYVTCMITAKCLDHKLLDSRPGRNTEAADTLTLTLAHIWIGAVFYFYQGNSNSLASVDLGSGYVGLSEYSPVRVAARMGLHAYAGPALSGAHLFCSLPYDDMNRYLRAVWRVINIMALQRVYQVVIYCVIAMIFRRHLFVWSVFSPKLLYDFVATIFTVQALLTIAEIIVLTRIVSWVSKCIAYRRLTKL